MKKIVKSGQVIFLMFIMLLIAGIPVAESVSPTASFTVRDRGGFRASYEGGIEYGLIQDPPLTSWQGEHFIEFDISGMGSPSEVFFDFNITNLNIDGRFDTPSKYFQIAYYSGSGSTNTSVFGTTGTWLGEYTLPDIDTYNFVVDVTDAYNSVSGNFLGFRMYDPVWTDSSSDEGHQLRYENSTLVTTVVPEPISSILFLVGGSTLAARRFMRRKKIDRQ